MYDVLCGRGKSALNHIGNRRFRVVVAANLTRYLSLQSRSEKTHLAMRIVTDVRQNGGRFLKQDGLTNIWYEIGNKMAREKVAHALRDAKADRTLRKASNKAGATRTSDLIRAQAESRDYVQAAVPLTLPERQISTHQYKSRRDPDGDSQFCAPPQTTTTSSVPADVATKPKGNGNKADGPAINIANILLHLQSSSQSSGGDDEDDAGTKEPHGEKSDPSSAIQKTSATAAAASPAVPSNMIVEA